MVSVWGLTDRGRVRRENQDSCAYAVLADQFAWGVVCDGMGGANAGDIASKMAVETVEATLATLPDENRTTEDGALLLQAVEQANQRIYEKATTEPACTGMGTTLVGLIVRNGALLVANVGDSRAYHITKTGIRRITRDHSVVEDLVEKGDLTPEEARQHPQKNLITRALGTSRQVRADLFQQEVAEGDMLLLCSDGLVNEVTDEAIYQQAHAGGTPQEICQRLMNETLEHGAPDNVTIVLFQL